MYSPDDISFRSQTMTVEKLLAGMRDGHIDFKRQDYDSFTSSAYIESVIIGLPLLPIVFDGSKAPWRIIDGSKRLQIIWDFAFNRFRLDDASFYHMPEHLSFDEMNPYLKNRFFKAVVPCYIINPGTPPDVIYEIRKRIRTDLSI